MHYVGQSWELYTFNVKNMHDESTEENYNFFLLGNLEDQNLKILISEINQN